MPRKAADMAGIGSSEPRSECAGEAAVGPAGCVPRGGGREHEHFGYWINRELRTARCYECGFQFIADDDSAEEWDGTDDWEGESRLNTEMLAGDPNTKGDDAILVTLGNGAQILVASWRGTDGVPVIQIDTAGDPGTGRLRINLNDGTVWDGDPNGDQTRASH